MRVRRQCSGSLPKRAMAAHRVADASTKLGGNLRRAHA